MTEESKKNDSQVPSLLQSSRLEFKNNFIFGV